jgi:hypothetical protein
MDEPEMQQLLAEVARTAHGRSRVDAIRLMEKLRAAISPESDSDQPGDPLADLDELEPRRRRRSGLSKTRRGSE